MKYGRIQPNPRFTELQETLRNHPDWLKPWSGIFFRFQTIDFPAGKDILGGQGACQRGGRWNQPGIAALYGSTTDSAALEESKADDRYYGVVTTRPRLLIAIEAQLVGMLDLTSDAIHSALGINPKDLAAEDWRKLLQARQESISQALGRAAAATGASGLLARSARTPLGVNVVVFPPAHENDRLKVIDGDKLLRFGTGTRP